MNHADLLTPDVMAGMHDGAMASKEIRQIIKAGGQGSRTRASSRGYSRSRKRSTAERPYPQAAHSQSGASDYYSGPPKRGRSNGYRGPGGSYRQAPRRDWKAR